MHRLLLDFEESARKKGLKINLSKCASLHIGTTYYPRGAAKANGDTQEKQRIEIPKHPHGLPK